tara:strand:+ start:543 stop:914 length:372 start_codon:yes stop_codon:yes gene_type:complete
MGLDQFAYKVKSKYNSDTVTEKITKIKIAQWRKHNALEGYMSALFKSKGGDGEFNCRTLPLDNDDLNELEETINNKELPETEGFFFGNDTSKDEECNAQDKQFIDDAREALENGWQIEYTSWW